MPGSKWQCNIKPDAKRLTDSTGSGKGPVTGGPMNTKLNLGFNEDGKLSSGRDRWLLRRSCAALRKVS